jgi:hypothetical protein
MMNQRRFSNASPATQAKKKPTPAGQDLQQRVQLILAAVETPFGVVGHYIIYFMLTQRFVQPTEIIQLFTNALFAPIVQSPIRRPKSRLACHSPIRTSCGSVATFEHDAPSDEGQTFSHTAG